MTTTEKPWQPTDVGELFMLVVSGTHRALMRVLAIRPDGYDAVRADLDDALTVDPDDLVEVRWTPPTSWT